MTQFTWYSPLIHRYINRKLFDSTAILVSLIASVITTWPTTEHYTFGYGRVETLTGFINALALAAAAVGIIWESIERLIYPPELKKESMLVVAVLGFLVNLGKTWDPL